jgi:ppGpp synthetase/RelA/SpoT-type nucleotidyltranferase
VNTLVDKLRRERTMALTTVQDIAGVRVVLRPDRREQDAVVARLSSRFPSARVTDRRATPSHGYRAVHLVVDSGGCLVEIQVRTLLQDVWAQLVERIADRWGRGIRYGQEPEDPDRQEQGVSRREIWRLVGELGDAIARAEVAQLASADDRPIEVFEELAAVLRIAPPEG